MLIEQQWGSLENYGLILFANYLHENKWKDTAK